MIVPGGDIVLARPEFTDDGKCSLAFFDNVDSRWRLDNSIDGPANHLGRRYPLSGSQGFDDLGLVFRKLNLCAHHNASRDYTVAVMLTAARVTVNWPEMWYRIFPELDQLFAVSA